jgi:hypothetical protein
MDAPVLFPDSLHKDRQTGRTAGIEAPGMDECVDVYCQQQCGKRNHKDPHNLSQNRSVLKIIDMLIHILFLDSACSG